MKKASSAFAAMIAITAPAWAGDKIPLATGGRTYVQHQIMAEKARHPEIASIVVYGVRDPAEGPVIMGSTIDQASVFRKAPALPVEGVRRVGDSVVVATPYVNRTDRPIGMIEVRFRHGSPEADSAVAKRIGASLQRATYSAQNAVDPYPYDASVSTNTHAQALTRQVIAMHPDVVVMMIHAKAPGSGKNIVIGSNVGRIGKQGDEDDLKVAEEGATNLGFNSDGDQYEVEVPMLDAQNRRIGALGLVFAFKPGDDKEALNARGLAIRDELAPMIRNGAQLFASAR